MKIRIYKISNEREKVAYVGATSRTLEDRLSGHFRMSQTTNNTFHSYLRECNPSEITICELDCIDVEADKLFLAGELELKWIERVHSEGYKMLNSDKRNGYSANQVKITNIEEIISKYHILKSCRKTAKLFNIDKDTVSEIVRSNNIKMYDAADRMGMNVVLSIGGKEYSFKSKTSAANFIKEELSLPQSVGTLRKKIGVSKIQGVEIISVN